jgi:hypothetical protein
MDPEAWPARTDCPHANGGVYRAACGASKSRILGAGRLVGSSMPTRRPLPYRRRGLGRLGPLALALILMAIGCVAAGGIVFVLSPGWGGQGAAANSGRVPDSGGRLVDFIAPHRIEIPKLHAVAPIVRVGTADRELQIPLNPRVVGWWDGGAKPGAHRGTAILAGHINYAGVSGVLGDIGTLHPGDKVYVTGRHKHRRERLRFTVTGVRTYRKTALPYRKIFNQRSIGRLAIVTCGGAFDSSTGNYADNIVVFAVPS